MHPDIVATLQASVEYVSPEKKNNINKARIVLRRHLVLAMQAQELTPEEGVEAMRLLDSNSSHDYSALSQF